MKRILVVLLAVAIPLVAFGANINSAANSTALNAAIASASPGDTIYVQSGNFGTWNVTLSKRVSIIGGGQGSGQTPGTTTIANTSGTINIVPTLGSETNQLRLAYFTLTKSSTSAFNPVVNWGSSTTHYNLGGTNPYNARLDHCIILAGSGGVCVTTWDTLYGVIDNCTFGSSSQRHNYGIYGETVYTIVDFNNSVNYPWYPGLQGNGKSVYIEDCIFWPSSDGWRAGTSNEGGRICWRYNTVNIASGGYSQALWDIHGSQGTACAAWGHEYYGNIAVTGDCNAIADVRSGRNMIFWNAGNNLGNAAQNYWGQFSVCTTSTLPGEQQINRAYYWNNRAGPTGVKRNPYTGTTLSGTCGGYVNPPQAGQNYYGENTSPAITAGLLADRPAASTNGQGYWAVAANNVTGLTNLTNYVGDINTYPSRQTIAGTFYVVVSGAWTSWYEPYTYPHPLRGAPATPQVATPSFAPAAGSYFGTQSVSITCSTPGAVIRYTTDGTDPTASSTQYVSPLPTSTTVPYRARAFLGGMTDSAVASATYEVGTWISGAAWKNFAVPQQTGIFTWTFRASASSAASDSVIGLSPVTSTVSTDLAPIILFTNSGVVQARNGGAYAAVNPFTYVAGTTYEFVFTINVPSKTYSVTAAQISGTPVVIATNYAFRSEQATASDLDNVGISVATSGTLTVSQMSFGGAASIPTLTGATVGASGTTLTLEFSETVSYGVGGNGGWTMSASGGAVTLTPTANPTSFTTSRTIAVGETGTISYTQPGNGVEAVTGGGDLATLTGFSFNNQSTIDLTAPTPNPMTFSTIPNATSTATITMTASLASDASGVQYYFDEVSGNNGATDSVWQTSRTYTDTGLSPGRQYTYRVIARDTSPAQNQTVPSAPVDVITPIAGGGKVVTPAGTSGAAFANP